MKSVPKRIKRGDLILVHWLDPVGSAGATPETQSIAPCVTPGFFWGVKRDKGMACLVTWLTRHPGWGAGEEEGSGADTTPLVNVKHIEVLRKAKDVKFWEGR